MNSEFSSSVSDYYQSHLNSNQFVNRFVSLHRLIESFYHIPQIAFIFHHQIFRNLINTTRHASNSSCSKYAMLVRLCTPSLTLVFSPFAKKCAPIKLHKTQQNLWPKLVTLHVAIRILIESHEHP
jgi:hypothetical protein